MSVVLLVLAILLTAAGCVLIGYGIPIKELGFDPTLLVAGSHAVVGGLLLLGLSAALAELRRVRTALKQQPLQGVARSVRVAEMLPPQPIEAPTREPAVVARAPAAVAREPVAANPEPVAREPVMQATRETVVANSGPPATSVAPPAAVEASEIAIERLRSSLPRPDKNTQELEDAPLSPSGQADVTVPVPPQRPPQLQPQPQTDPVPGFSGGAAVETREPKLDFLFRPRPTRSVPQPNEAFDSLWPTRPAREAQTDPRLGVARAHPGPSSPTLRAAAILKSGVVDGMAYTLYADGSIEAQLPQGTMRFSSIAELRAHIETNS